MNGNRRRAMHMKVAVYSIEVHEFCMYWNMSNKPAPLAALAPLAPKAIYLYVM